MSTGSFIGDLNIALGQPPPTVMEVIKALIDGIIYELKGSGKGSRRRPAAKKTAAKRKPKMSKNNDIGVYDGGFQKKKAQTKKQSNGMDKRKQRGELIKKIMKERNVNLATASKIIKQESLM
jgi:hypothetical protein